MHVHSDVNPAVVNLTYSQVSVPRIVASAFIGGSNDKLNRLLQNMHRLSWGFA